MEKMKPCPFCGGDAELNIDSTPNSNGDVYWVVCNNMDCPVCPSTELYCSARAAINAWNTRANED